MSAPPLHIESHGEGPALLLMHGFAGSARNFRPQARRLQDRFRILLFDARGHARSEAPTDPGAYTTDAMVEDVARVLDAQGVDRAVVGGLSLGAAIAARFAVAHPSRVRALVLASLPAGADVGGVAASASDFADVIDQDGLEAAGERFVWGAASGLDARGAALVRQGFLEHPPHGIAAMLRGVLAELTPTVELAPRLAALALPVLLIAGGADAPSLAATRALAAALPDARFLEIPGAGHVVNLERPEIFTKELAEFLEGLPR